MDIDGLGLTKRSTGNQVVVESQPSTDVQPPSQKAAANKPRRGRSSVPDRHHNSLVVIGHVDAGKSTLFGRLLYDLGNIDERSMQRLKRESEKMQKSSFAYAWAMDSSVEERERGVTIDIATNSFKSHQKAFTILDAPGHRDFVPNMIAGASQADFAVMVVDASRGAFESGFDAAGQTKEHAILTRSLGIQRVIIAINKLDNVEWSQERYKDIKIQLTTFLRHTGFEETSLSFIPCSGLTGENVVNSLRNPQGDWYHGRSLLQEMESITNTVARSETAPFRMIVSDVQSTPNSSNVTVTGRIATGELQKNDTILCMPSGESATIKGLHIEDEVESAFAGDTATLILADIDPIHLRTGDILCHSDDAVTNVNAFVCQMVTFQMLRPLLTGSSVVLHRGRADIPAVVKKLELPNKKQSGEYKAARHITSTTQCLVTFELIRGVIPMEPFAQNKDLGRIIVRREGDTIAAGVVTKLL